MIAGNDTIAAIATPSGNSGIGIVRISGTDAVKIADEVIRSRSGKSLDLFSVNSHTVHYGFIFDGNTVIDEVLCTVYRSPRSFTSEDTVEINCHGGMFVLNRVLSLLLSKGARLAEPGEFTRRAFLNGRIDLSQAESVMDIISSENEFSRSNSLSQLRGSVKEEVSALRDTILHETAFIEVALDDP
ncbi:MAG: tRNA uridine-5-carboxymethylaminomethyl(34) synthesis GTPase MnmE, partial [Lachnospiraceae bacterium]|nr:tRNA uridine-5-carboxymethylaminomethyl(34) synthesis GTPase MnmE [Lachnospiraceae bacterium]